MRRLILGALMALAGAAILTTSGVSGQGRVDSPGVMTPEGGVPALGSYKVPKTPWGEPDLQGTYNANDLQGVPMQRAETVGTRYRLNDDEFKQRVAQRDQNVANDNSDEFSLERAEEFEARFGTVGGAVSPPPHWLERARTRQPRVLVRHRSARRTDSGVDARGPGRGAAASAGAGRPPSPAERHRSRLDHRSQQLRPLHQHRRAEFDHAEDLQLRQPHRAGAGLARVPERDDPRDARHPDGRPQAGGRGGQELDGHVGWPLGRRRARRRNPQHQARVADQRPAPVGRGRADRTVHAGGREHARLPHDDQRPEGLHRAVDGADADPARRELRLLRIRVPRGELRDAQPPRRLARRGEAARRGGGSRREDSRVRRADARRRGRSRRCRRSGAAGGAGRGAGRGN